ncbi:proline dehydrogenase family protein [Methylophaga sp. OBS4]|uniref:proline dehydrogenase family protein n=1 Tax=Methylophaga sp. OBS4 TaxID=2991935 RepID=UPI002252B1D7|nr:proline dehydrogenase family protein [Methylophaga sp. OBS4]MCX4186619.1 proline dehydrogenase family protein [Methylophaga sp. OBS4]
MTGYPTTDIHLEPQIQAHGQRLIEAARRNAAEGRAVDRWLLKFIQGLMENEHFRVQALRFVDVLPALSNDRDLVDHLFAYFNDEELAFFSDAATGMQQLRKITGNKLIAMAVRKAVSRIARYYMGGADAQEALKTGRKLRDQNILFSLDMLGEAALSEKETAQYQQNYLAIIETLATKTADWPIKPALDQANGEAVPIPNLSIKPSSLYSRIRAVDPQGSIEGLVQMLRPVFASAKKHGAAICLDMEQFEFKDIILASFKKILMEQEFRNWPHAGVAMQAYLKETEQDLKDMIEWAKQRGTPVLIRLVRGAYWDYETITATQFGWDSPVWEQKWQTDQNYDRCVEILLRNINHVTPAIATHNIRSLAHALSLAEQAAIKPDQFEFQMLFGMSPHMVKAVSDSGYRLRVYVPFGELIPGMAYLTRRLLENASSQSFRRMSMQDEEIYSELSPPEEQHQTGTANMTQSAAGDKFKNESLHRFTSENERAAFAQTLAKARQNLGQYYPLIIGGKEIKSDTVIHSVNRANPEQIIGEVACANKELGEQAVQAAQKALPDWSGKTMQQRADILLQAAGLLRKRRDQFAALEILEAGKTWQEADANITEAIDFLEFYAHQAISLDRPNASNTAGETNDHLYRAKGVGVVIPPWNFPLAILTGMLSATLVTGNTAILKPSSQTPVIAANMVNLLHEAGLPREVVQFLPGTGSDIGDFLVQHPAVHVIAFTGSLAVGRRIVNLASQLADSQQHFKHVVAEMGGKNAIIIDSDAEPDEAVASTIESAFGYQGQKCSAASRVIVVGDHYDYFLERLGEATRSLLIGDPAAPGTQVGPVISASAYKDILQAIEQGKQVAEVLLEMPIPENLQGYFIGPVIFRDVPVDSALFQEEIFGPVLAVTKAESFEQAIDYANRCAYGLTGGLYSRNPDHIEQARQQLQVGNLYINRKITRAFVERQPFGGFKLSGLGSKAGGRDYLLHFTNPVTVTENTMRRGYAPEKDTS